MKKSSSLTEAPSGAPPPTQQRLRPQSVQYGGATTPSVSSTDGVLPLVHKTENSPWASMAEGRRAFPRPSIPPPQPPVQREDEVEDLEHIPALHVPENQPQQAQQEQEPADRRLFSDPPSSASHDSSHPPNTSEELQPQHTQVPLPEEHHNDDGDEDVDVEAMPYSTVADEMEEDVVPAATPMPAAEQPPPPPLPSPPPPVELLQRASPPPQQQQQQQEKPQQLQEQALLPACEVGNAETVELADSEHPDLLQRRSRLSVYSGMQSSTNNNPRRAPSSGPPTPNARQKPEAMEVGEQMESRVDGAPTTAEMEELDEMPMPQRRMSERQLRPAGSSVAPTEHSTTRRSVRSHDRPPIAPVERRPNHQPLNVDVEELIPLSHSRPVDRFFVDCPDQHINRRAGADALDITDVVDDVDHQPRNEDEMLLERFAIYTDDDSFFTSGSTVIDDDPRGLVNGPLRNAAIATTHTTLQVRAYTGGRVPEELLRIGASRANWLYQIHRRDVALEHSSLFIFPARWMPRVVAYNLLHHWVMELIIFLAILAYSIFQACWARYTAPVGGMSKPQFMLWADVFFTMMLGVELLLRLFASGLVMHPRSFLRSPWRWLDLAVLILMILECTWWQQLWNFTAWRLIRGVKCLTYTRLPIRMKLLAKSVLRSTNRVLQLTIFFVYFIFFFGLLGLRLFKGELHSRCVSLATGAITDIVCRPESNGDFWFYWGNACSEGYTCMKGFSNPHYDFQNFDDVGHAMLSAFQIATNQGWAGLYDETSGGLAVMAILYYFFTILICAWIIPSLFLGIFIEKMEKTNHLYELKQIDRFDRMLGEQRQHINAKVRLRDFVERDDDGYVPHYPSYNNAEGRVPQNYACDYVDEQVNSIILKSTNNNGAVKAISQIPALQFTVDEESLRKPIGNTRWTDEQRVQLHLSLTRQRDLIESSARGAADGDQAKTYITTTAPSLHSPRPVSGGDSVQRFALGGRIGEVQHHPSTHTIGASAVSQMPFAVRQESAAEGLRFYDQFMRPGEDEEEGGEAGAADVAAPPTILARPSIAEREGSHAAAGASAVSLISNPGDEVVLTKESAGVVPNQARLESARNSRTARRVRLPAEGEEGGDVPAGASTTRSKQSGAGGGGGGGRSGPTALLVNDPEGGDLHQASSFMERVHILQNMVHMATEGYPRILTLYLWEHKVMLHRYGLRPLTYTSAYEEEALRQLRRRRRGAAGGGKRMDLDDAENPRGLEQQDWKPMVRDSSVEMARDIREHAPITPLGYIMYLLIFLNGVFNAIRYDGQPDHWEDALFYITVVFSACFTVELLMRVFALGPTTFAADVLYLIEGTFVVLSLFQLGFSRANTISLFNWVRFLKLLRRIPCRPLRLVLRVLRRAAPDILYALIIFSMYMFMWLLLGMSFFGSRMGWINYAKSDYNTRGSFESFSYACYAIAQAFSVNRDEWLYLTWSGMRVRGGYTVMYFILTVLVAVVFRYLFIAIFTSAWQLEEAERAEEEAAVQSGEIISSTPSSRRGQLLHWFDFSVWRSFKHIHGGFKRRDVAPDEVYYLNEDMRRQLRLAEAFDRRVGSQSPEHGGAEDVDAEPSWDAGEAEHLSDVVEEERGLRYINIGGHLERQESAARADRRIDRAAAPSLQLGAAQLRFARQYHAVPALEVAPAPAAPAALRRAGEVPEVVGGRGGSVVPAQLPRLTRQTPGRLPSSAMAGSAHRSVEEEEDEEEEVMASQNRHDEDSSGWEHLLLPGPRLRFKNIIAPDGRRAFERCLDCNTHKQMPLRAPRGVMQRTPDQLHEEHCHMAAVRSSRQLVLKALLGYVRLQLEHAMPPTRELVETVLGQAWGCGMLLYDTIEHLACEDLPEEERTWHRMLETLELQQWLLGLHVGEEQVGRATLAYLLAHQKRQDQLLTRKMATAAVNSRGVPTTTGDGTLLDQSAEEDHWMNRSLFIFSPSNPVRVAVAKVVDATWFEALILIIIFAATICLACYVPRNAGNLDMGGSYNSNTYKALHVLDDIFTVCFVVEMLLKWVRMGVVLPRNTAYMWSLLNIFDCFIVVISIVSWADDDVKCRYLKALRLFRILGPLRYWESNHSMAEIARTLWESVPLLANVALIMLMNYVVWAIIFISMFSEKMYFCTSSKYATEATCVAAGHSWTHVVRNFRNFYESLLTTFEISTGAEWLDVMYSAVDSWSTTDAMRRNRHPYLGLVFVAYYYVSHLVLISLFISAVVYLYFLTRNAAEGASGVTLEHQVWIRMQNMVLTIAPRPQLLPMKSMLSRITHKVVCFWWFEFIMAILLLCNALTMSLEWYGMSHGQQVTLDVLQYIFIAAFTAEVVLRLVAHGKRCFTRISFCWDLLVTVLSYLQIILNSTSNHYMPFNVNVLRLLRLQRILVVVDLLPLPVATYFGLFQEILRASVPGLINISLIYILAVYVFAIVGMHLVGYVVPNGGFVDGTYNNFLTFVNSLVMVFRLSTLENWVAMMRGSMTRGYGSCTSSDGRCGTSNWVPIFFVPIVVLFYWMIITLYMAVVVDQYITSVRLRASIARLADLHRFRDVWAAKDRNATLVLPTSALPGLLEALRLPLGLSRKHNRVELLRLLREYNIPDRGGMMYYYDVLIPLARRVIAMAIHDSREMEGKQSYDLAWRLSERTMSSLPLAVSTDVFALTPYRYTTTAHFAAAYIQAAYRRNRAQRAAIIERSLKWRQSREACDELHLSYDGYGFGAYRLSGPDPREDGRDRGLLSVSRQRSMRSGSEQQQQQQQQNGEEEEADRSPATVLPRVYQSAIGDLSPEPKMFGPAAADPIRRHEKRAEKLRRDQRPPSSQPNVGEDANNIEAWMQGQEDPASVPTSRARSRPMAAEDDPLQPPLGTDPEVLRTSELNRRRSAWPQAASPSVEVPPSAEAH